MAVLTRGFYIWAKLQRSQRGPYFWREFYIFIGRVPFISGKGFVFVRICVFFLSNYRILRYLQTFAAPVHKPVNKVFHTAFNQLRGLRATRPRNRTALASTPYGQLMDVIFLRRGCSMTCRADFFSPTARNTSFPPIQFSKSFAALYKKLVPLESGRGEGEICDSYTIA